MNWTITPKVVSQQSIQTRVRTVLTDQRVFRYLQVFYYCVCKVVIITIFSNGAYARKKPVGILAVFDHIKLTLYRNTTGFFGLTASQTSKRLATTVLTQKWLRWNSCRVTRLHGCRKIIRRTTITVLCCIVYRAHSWRSQTLISLSFVHFYQSLLSQLNDPKVHALMETDPSVAGKRHV